MAWAVDNNYIVFSHDLDFGTLLAISEAITPSVIQDVFPENLSGLVLNALKQFKSELESGTLIMINKEKAKARVPLIKRES